MCLLLNSTRLLDDMLKKTTHYCAINKRHYLRLTPWYHTNFYTSIHVQLSLYDNYFLLTFIFYGMISSLCVARSTNTLRRNVKYLSAECRIIMYTAIVASNSNHYTIVWRFCGYTMKSLEIWKVHKRSLNVVFKLMTRFVTSSFWESKETNHVCI